jgi:hypothetical protein
VSGPDAERWEVYTVIEDTDTTDGLIQADGSCACEPVAVGAVTSAATESTGEITSCC